MESWYRRFLLVVASGTFCFVPIELALSEHTGSTMQWVPFAVSGLALSALTFWRFNRTKWAFITVKTVMIVSCASSLLGVVEHFKHNLEFELEIRPGIGWSDVLVETISGASPLLAPGILFLAGILVLAALYRWPTENATENAT
jgi:hypothetical protein